MAAEQDSPLFSQERHPLTLSTEGKVTTWFQALHQKRLWAEEHDPRADSIQIELDLAGGGMQGVLHVGLLLALQERGMLEHIDRIMGVSTGAIAAVTAIGMNNPAAIDTYLHVAMHGIVSPRRIPFRNAVDLQRLYDAIRPLIDEERIRTVHTQLSSIVTDVESGLPREIDVTNHLDPLRAAIASAAIPGITKSPFELPLRDGKHIRTIDGMVSAPYPESTLDNGVEDKTKYRLVVSPYPVGEDMHWFHRSIMVTDPRLYRHPNALHAVWNLNDAGRHDLAMIRLQIDGGKNVGLVYPDQVLDAFSQDWLNHLRPYQHRAYERYEELIEEAFRPTVL